MSTASSGRLPALDVLRGLTIVAMIVFHFCLVYYPAPSNLLTATIHFIGSLVGRFFLFMAGAGTWFFLQRYPPIKLLWRGVFLFVLTYLIGVFIKGRYYPDWSLIQDIGFCFIVIALIATVSSHRFWPALMIYLFFFWLFVQFNFESGGIFPIFPLAIYFIAGYGIAAMCPVRRSGSLMAQQVLPVLSLSLGLVAVGLIARTWTIETRFDWTAVRLARIGGFMILYSVFVYGFGPWDFSGFFGRASILFGRISLSSYYYQQLLVVYLLATGFQVMVVSRPISYILLTSAVLASLYAILRVWQTFRFVGSLEWWMRRLG